MYPVNDWNILVIYQVEPVMKLAKLFAILLPDYKISSQYQAYLSFPEKFGHLVEGTAVFILGTSLTTDHLRYSLHKIETSSTDEFKNNEDEFLKNARQA